jgi:hypothetical protein
VPRVLIALCCLLSLLLSGCSDSSSSLSSADPPPHTPSSSSPAPSPTEEPETPEEFVRRWVDADNEMQNTGETAKYRKLSSLCRPCIEVADQVERYYAAGGYVKTEGWTIKSLSTEGSAKSQLVRLAVVSTPTEVVEAKGKPVIRLEGGEGTYLLSLKARGPSWVLDDLEAAAQ